MLKHKKVIILLVTEGRAGFTATGSRYISIICICNVWSSITCSKNVIISLHAGSITLLHHTAWNYRTVVIYNPDHLETLKTLKEGNGTNLARFWEKLINISLSCLQRHLSNQIHTKEANFVRNQMQTNKIIKNFRP